MSIEKSLRRGRVAGLILAGAALVSGCAADIAHRTAPGQFPVVEGPPVTSNPTPFSEALRCVSDKIKLKTDRRVAVTVGAVRDYTGKFAELEGGNAITQGGSLMAISALGKMGKGKLFMGFGEEKASSGAKAVPGGAPAKVGF